LTKRLVQTEVKSLTAMEANEGADESCFDVSWHVNGYFGYTGGIVKWLDCIGHVQ